MNDPGSTFRVVMRGFEPNEVNRRIEELTAAVAQATAQRDAVVARLEALERERSEAPDPTPVPVEAEPPTFGHLGARVGEILTLAEQEADELRRTAGAELAAERQRLEEDTARMREEAERYATETRSSADTEATRIIEGARRAADERLDSSERDAAARIQEAEAIYEEQRAKAVQSAADFEATLAARRKAAEEEFQRQMEQVERQLEEARRTLEVARTDAQQAESAAKLEARNLVRAAEEQAASIVDEARTRAVRVRAESDRELAAATQRRDAINAQLGNVRQMLATLTGSVTAPDPFATTESDQAVEQPHDEDSDESAGSGDSAEAEPESVPDSEHSTIDAR